MIEKKAAAVWSERQHNAVRPILSVGRTLSFARPLPSRRSIHLCPVFTESTIIQRGEKQSGEKVGRGKPFWHWWCAATTGRRRAASRKTCAAAALCVRTCQTKKSKRQKCWLVWLVVVVGGVVVFRARRARALAPKIVRARPLLNTSSWPLTTPPLARARAFWCSTPPSRANSKKNKACACLAKKKGPTLASNLPSQKNIIIIIIIIIRRLLIIIIHAALLKKGQLKEGAGWPPSTSCRASCAGPRPPKKESAPASRFFVGSSSSGQRAGGLGKKRRALGTRPKPLPRPRSGVEVARGG